jgi:hypothetical protein
LLASLPALLEPFSTLTPILHALWQNSIALTELAYKGHYERARARLIGIYENLEHATGQDIVYLDALRNAVAHAIALVDVTLGNPAAEHWLAKLERDPQQRVNALYLRRAQCIFDGDSEAAERYRKQAEVLAVQATSRQMFEPPITLELYLQVHAGDLTAVRRAADRIAELAAISPGWTGQHHLAQGSFHRLRGDLPAARAAFERAMEAENPNRLDPPPVIRVWGVAAEGYTAVLEGMGLFEEAREVAQRACDTCEALEVVSLYGLSRALALVEARLGDYARAAARLDALIKKREHLRPSVRALDFEARAKVAIWAGDASAAAHFTCLATEDAAAHGGVQRLARRGRLLDEARRAGLRLDIPQAGIESTLHRSSVRPEHAHAHAARALVAAAFGPLPNAAARAQRALELLAEALGSRVGHLYYAASLQLAHRAALGAVADAALDRFANGYFRHRSEQAAMTTVFTNLQLDAYALATASWSSPAGVAYVLIPLSPVGEAECVGLVALAAVSSPIPPEYWAMSAAISAWLIESGDVAIQAATG